MSLYHILSVFKENQCKQRFGEENRRGVEGKKWDLNVNLTLSEGERERNLGTGFLDCPVAGGRVDKAVGSPRATL